MPDLSSEPASREIDGRTQTVEQLLSGVKYGIDTYQRDYCWQRKQIEELIEDLSQCFLDESSGWKPGHPTSAVESYGHYFLGSIVLTKRGSRSFIIDGQQRLTSLTLLVMFLDRWQREIADAKIVDGLTNLVFSAPYGEPDFNLSVDERRAVMQALLDGTVIDTADQPFSAVTIKDRYEDISRLLPEAIDEAAVPHFIYWLKKHVHLVRIEAFHQDDAYTIFETMNDRGLSLSDSDKLKGYLLSKISDPVRQRECAKLWQEQMAKLAESDRNAPAEFFKAWLRAKYAQDIRERKKGSTNKDFEQIGNQFHRWVRDHDDLIGLTTPDAFESFIRRDLVIFARHFLRIRAATETLTKGLESIYYNAYFDFTLQIPAMLSPITVDDTTEQAEQKMRLVAGYLELLIARRQWNYKQVGYSAMVFGIFTTLIKPLRSLDVTTLGQRLGSLVGELRQQFSDNPAFRLHGQNKPAIRYFLARITRHLEEGVGIASQFTDYINRGDSKPFEIEHLWAEKPERFASEFPSANDFLEYRNHIGGLVLIPRGFNQSYNDATYDTKRPLYRGQNLLAASLDPDTYEYNPNLRSFLSRSGLPVQAHPQFTRADLDNRQALYIAICEQIWNPQRVLSL